VLAAYREGLRLVREAAGPGCTLVGAAAPLLPSIGLVDAMRTGPGVAPVWAPPGGDQSHASLSSALATTGARAWQHGRLWVSAPGCLLAAPWVGRRRVWAGHLAAAAGAASSGDRPSLLDQAGVELTRRVLRPSSPFPVAWVPDDGPEPAVVALLA
jgi:alpha-galactosidase